MGCHLEVNPKDVGMHIPSLFHLDDFMPARRSEKLPFPSPIGEK